jgi:hypothetical protein
MRPWNDMIQCISFAIFHNFFIHQKRHATKNCYLDLGIHRHIVPLERTYTVEASFNLVVVWLIVAFVGAKFILTSESI